MKDIEQDDYYIPPKRIKDNSLNTSISHYVYLENQYNKTGLNDYKRKQTILANKTGIKRISANKCLISDNISNRTFVLDNKQYRNGAKSNLVIGKLL